MKKWNANKTYFILTSIITILPMIVGILLWKQLPDQVAIHFGIDNTPNGWSSKWVAVFVLPLLCLAVHIFCAVSILFDPKQKAVPKRIYQFILLICPIISLVCGVCIYGYALSYPINIGAFIKVFVGIIFVIAGNYLPKCRQNHIVGIKIPWTLSDEENWNHTHWVAGWIWVICGLIFILDAFLNKIGFGVFIIFGIMVLIPVGYSFFYYWKHRTS